MQSNNTSSHNNTSRSSKAVKQSPQKQNWQQKTLNLAMAIAFSLPTLGLGAGLATSALAPIPAHAFAQDFSELVEQVSPAVVRVNVTKEVGGSLNGQEIPEIFRRFFGDQMPAPQARLQRAYGSAFFVTTDGYLLTNHHVVEGADKITITLNDRREVDAKLIGSDERTDVAVLKVEGGSYPALRIGSTSNLKVGQPVLAIGSPFGFDYSASSGIISATSRNISDEKAVPFIQTDVALNPGNSGGPLFDTSGDVIGINSRIFSGTGGYMGLSFSIPIDLAMDIYQQIKTTGQVVRPYLGVYPQDIDRNLAEVYKLPRPQGALITQVGGDTAAAKAGIKAGDIILQYNGQDITRATDLINAINRARVGDTFSVRVLRDGSYKNLAGRLGEAPDTTAKQLNDMRDNNSAPSLGLGLRDLSSREAAELKEKGVLITSIDPTGLAARAGLTRGDVVTRLNGMDTPNVRNFASVLKKLPESGVVEVRILRRGSPAILGLRIK